MRRSALALVLLGLLGALSAGPASAADASKSLALPGLHIGALHARSSRRFAEPVRRRAAQHAVATGRRSRTPQPVSEPATLVAAAGPCTTGPSCDPGPSTTVFPDYGDAGPNGIPDCTFAAAADWEQIVLLHMPDPAVVEAAFTAAGGTDQGLDQNALWAYWQEAGIDGVALLAAQPVPNDPADLETAVRAIGAVIAQLQLSDAGIGPFIATPGLHDVVVDGFTPAGPLVVSWGQTIQMSWQQWSAEDVAVWTLVVAAPATPDTAA